MCNACGFGCCAADLFERCGCEDCENPLCWPVCVECGEYEWDCTCFDNDFEEEEDSGEDYQP